MNIGRNISLTEHLNRFIDTQIERGRHQNASEVVREALRRYEDEVVEEEARIAALRAIADEGRQAIARGDYVALRSADDIDRLIGDLSEEAARAVAGERQSARRG